MRRAIGDNARHDDPAVVRPLVPCDGRIDGHDNAVAQWNTVHPQGFEHLRGPERPFGIGQEHAVQFLSTKAGARIAALHLV